MSELVHNLFAAMGSWKAIEDLIDEIRHGNMRFERSSVSTIRATLDNGIFNHFTGGLNDVHIEISPHDECGVVFVDDGVSKKEISFRGGTDIYNKVLEFYKFYEESEERTAKSFFCLWDDATETYLD